MEMTLSTLQRDDNIVPLLYLIVFLCMAMSVMLFVEKVYMAIIILIKLVRKRPGRHPERQYIWEPIRENDEIVVKIPVLNENEVYQLSIGAACRVSWTSDRIIIQMLDDSTDPVIKEHNREEEVMEDENERNQGEEIRTTEEKEDENERNQEEEIRRTTEEKEDENERNQEEEIRTTEENEDENERDQEEEIRTTEEKKRRKRGGDERKSQAKRRKKAEGRRKRGGDTLGERKSQAKRRKIAEDDEERKKGKQQCRWVRSCMAMGCAAIFTSALIYLCAANILEEETIYLVPT